MQQQQAAPMAAGTQPPAGGGGQEAPPVDPVFAAGAFGPTNRPNEPITASSGGGILPDDPLEFARAVFTQAPSEDLRRLLAMYDSEPA